MATSEMAGFGPITSAWEDAGFNMVASTRQQTGFNLLNAIATSKVAARLVSGVTIALMGQ